MKENLTHILRVLLAGVVTGLALSLLIALSGLIFGWRSSVEFSNGLFLAGSAAIIFGLLSLWGGFTSRGNFALTDIQTDGDMSIGERAKWLAIEVLRGYNVVGTMTVVGAVMIGISIISYQIFG
jgi:hypothetical protein